MSIRNIIECLHEKIYLIKALTIPLRITCWYDLSIEYHRNQNQVFIQRITHNQQCMNHIT